MKQLPAIVILGVIFTTHAASLEREDGQAQSDNLPMSRLERVEKMLEQFQIDWRNEKQILLAENQGLKSQIEEMQRELAIVKQQQQQHYQQQQPKMKPKGVRLTDHVRLEESGADGPSRHLMTSRPDDQVLTSRSDDHVLRSRSDDHALTSRSDDFGSLGVEVSQLAQAVTGLTADVQALQTSTTQLQNGQGSSFVQWGSSTCPGSAQLVYSGVLGGSWYQHTGAAANPLCLTMDPVLEDEKSGVSYTLIYGGEYETGDAKQNMDPACAVCRTPHHQTTIMVPGTNVCSAGWTKQYSGYLMAGYHGHAGASEFICVDSKMDSHIASDDNDEGRLLYFTATQCGSLPCLPYQADKVMTCAVCSK